MNFDGVPAACEEVFKISELYEGHVDRESVIIDAREIDEVLYHAIPEVERLLKKEEGASSRWFRQLFLWYTAKPSDVRVIRDYRKGCYEIFKEEWNQASQGVKPPIR
jgi:hypothetical protein